jgi:branched-chain amino acid transport system ATP-binding protein
MTVAENVQMALLSQRGETRKLLPRADRRHREEALAVLALIGMADEATAPARRWPTAT